MNALQQIILDDQCEVLIPDFEPSEDDIKYHLYCLYEGITLKWETVDLNIDEVISDVASDFDISYSVGLLNFQKRTVEANLLTSSEHMRVATDKIKEAISNHNALARNI